MTDHVAIAAEAPRTLVYRRLCQDTIRDDLVQTQLQKDQTRLFINDLSRVSLKFGEAHSGGDDLSFEQIKGLDLETHLQKDGEDSGKLSPSIRHVFLSAAHSQKPLDCTLDALSRLCTHHRVSSEFADMLLTFGKPTGRLVGYHRPRCHLEIRPPSSVSGSSHHTQATRAVGWEMRNCYKLSAMELSSNGSSFVMRQMAVYHSLDLGNGRSFSLTVKADHKQIAERTKSLYRGAVPNTFAESFAASMETQLLALGWCVEGWTAYLNALEQQIRQISQKIVGIPMPTGQKTLVKRLTGLEKLREDPISRQNTSRSQVQQPSSLGQWIGSLFGEGQTRNDSAADSGIPMTDVLEASNPGEESMIERIERTAAEQVGLMQEFPFDGLQELHSGSTKLREAKLVMQLNAQTLREVQEHYRSAFDSDEIPDEIKSSCAMAHRSFQSSLENLEKLLTMECLRIDTLTQVAGDGNDLYGSILQLQGGQVGQLFAMAAHGAASRMESMTTNMHDIARNTERDTSSMHVITFFALVFLPGTFLGVRYYCQSSPVGGTMPSYLTDSQSFFSTPIFEGQDPNGPSRWSFNGELFALFAKICFPMMVITLLLWGWWTYRVKQRSVRVRAKGDSQV